MVIECLPGVHEVLGSTSSTTGRQANTRNHLCLVLSLSLWREPPAAVGPALGKSAPPKSNERAGKESWSLFSKLEINQRIAAI